MTGMLLSAWEATFLSGAGFVVWHYGVRGAFTLCLSSLLNGLLLIIALMTLVLAAPALQACSGDMHSVSHRVARRNSPGTSPRVCCTGGVVHPT